MKKVKIDRKIKEVVKNDWYIQGFNAVPIFLNTTAYSGFAIQKELGFSYNSFIFNYKNKYGEIGYLNSDFKKIWEIVKSKLKNNPGYIKILYLKYIKNFSKSKILFKKINRIYLKNISDEKLFDLFNKCFYAQINSAGIAHALEGVGMGLENELEKRLRNEIKFTNNKEYNKYFSILTTPSKISFVAKEENELRKIDCHKGEKRKIAFRNHLDKYFWILNSYAGVQKFTIKSLEKRLKHLSKTKKKLLLNKKGILKKYNLSQEIISVIKNLDIITTMQDERKKNIIMSIGYFDKVINEVSKRTKVSINLLCHLGVSDILKIKSINDFKKYEKTLLKRLKGVYFIMQNGKECSFLGNDFKELAKLQNQKLNTKKGTSNDIHGVSANLGKVNGRVIVCKNFSSINKVKEGDILVATMTRPEFVPAMKKAGAIITDEGGITCHAAVVSRELNIPCIIGTKYATKILKDGDEVEVNANHGVVKIIKK
jgi:phosphohistidine swiveling domain-containing protein